MNKLNCPEKCCSVFFFITNLLLEINQKGTFVHIMHAAIFLITTLELRIIYHQFIPGFEMVYASLIFEIMIISYMIGNKWIEN